eukprot:COSAG01_NODE_1585_length_9810_cov_8.980435_7_plen_32_part_00
MIQLGTLRLELGGLLRQGAPVKFRGRNRGAG